MNANGKRDTPFIADLKNDRGLPTYRLECHNGNYDSDEYTYSGDFQCALFGISGGKRTTGNLLAANDKNELSTDWWNRGRVLSQQLRGQCLTLPEYSTDRHFKLRGMLLRFQITDIKWGVEKDQQGDPLLEGFTFLADAMPDQSAQSNRAELPAGSKPSPSCYP